MGGLDGLVNNAGIVRLGPADQTTPAGLDLEFAVNVKGVLLASQEAAKRFTGKGAIVNIASNAGKVGYRNMAGYNASKAAVINLTRSLSLEWVEKGINVNAVCPGGVATDMLKSVADFLAPRLGQESGKLYDSMFPAQLGRHIQPIEVGRVVAFLLSDAAEIIRGQSINVDGGDTPY
jgi:NAD(P)-dependent dehydrogenase (short-subunit alcohol dehydrogenase family)